MKSSTKILVQIAGIPCAGKSTFADRVEESKLGFPHIPLDRYIKKVPEGNSFLDWVRTSQSIDWSLVSKHIADLFSGVDCTPPIGIKVDGTPKRSTFPTIRGGCDGLALPGTHSFSTPDGTWSVVKVFIDTPDHVLAERLLGRSVSRHYGSKVLQEHMGKNMDVLLPTKNQADLIISGEGSAVEQINALVAYLSQLPDD